MKKIEDDVRESFQRMIDEVPDCRMSQLQPRSPAGNANAGQTMAAETVAADANAARTVSERSGLSDGLVRRRAFALSIAAAAVTAAAVFIVCVSPQSGRFAQKASALADNPQIVKYAETLSRIRL